MARFGSSARTGLIWFAGLLAAGFSGMAAFASVSSTRIPLAAVDTVPENGRAYAEAADAELKLAIKNNRGILPDIIPLQSVDFARRAFALEPLAVQAPRIIALAEQAEGKTDQARKVMRLIPALSKREAAANVWLSNDYAKQGDDAAAFAYFDRTLRVSEGSAPLLIPPLVQGLEREDLRGSLAGLLRVGPPWEDDFWLEAVRRPEIAEPAMRLRMALGRKEGSALAVDRRLIANLVANREFAGALEYYRFLTGRKGAQDLTFPFERAPSFPPLDWELLTDGEFSASIEPRAGKMLISAGPATRGLVARRMLALGPGSYRANVKYTASPADDVPLTLGLRCAEAKGEAIRSEPFAPGSDKAQVLTLQGDCRYYLLEIDYRNDASIENADIAVDAILLRKES